MRPIRSGLAVACLLAGCAGHGDGAADPGPAAVSASLPCTPDVTLHAAADPGPPGSEAYLCVGLDVAPLAGKTIRALEWSAPVTAGASIHHAILYAVGGDFPDGPLPCEEMPANAVGMHVWAPGGTPLVLPAEVGLVLPDGTRRLAIQVHAIRTAAGPAPEVSARLCTDAAPPSHTAAWFAVQAPVPAIRPHHAETSTGQCRLRGALHLSFDWPHMHRVGRELHGALVREGGSRVALVDVLGWNFQAQRTYPIDVEAAAGDLVETTCVWQNDGDAYVLPGPRTTDEMCNQGLVAWPAAEVGCDAL